MSLYNNSTITKLAKYLPGTASELANRVGISDDSIIKSIGMANNTSWGSFRMQFNGHARVPTIGDRPVKVKCVTRTGIGVINIFTLPGVSRTGIFTRVSVTNVGLDSRREFQTKPDWEETTTTFTTTVNDGWVKCKYGKYRATLNKTSGVLMLEFTPSRQFSDFNTFELELKLHTIELSLLQD